MLTPLFLHRIEEASVQKKQISLAWWLGDLPLGCGDTIIFDANHSAPSDP